MFLDISYLEVHFNILLAKISSYLSECRLKDAAIEETLLLGRCLANLSLTEVSGEDNVVPFFPTPFVLNGLRQAIESLLFSAPWNCSALIYTFL